MDVAGAVADGPLDHAVDQVDHRVAGGHLVDGGLVFGAANLHQLEVALEVAHVLGQVVGIAVGVRRDAEDLLRAGQHRLHAAARQVLHRVRHGNRLRVGRAQVEHVAHPEEGQHPQPARHRLIDRAHRLRVVEPRAQPHEGNRELEAQGLEEILLGEPALFDHDLGHAAPRLVLEREGLLDDRLAHQTPLHQDLADAPPLPPDRGRGGGLGLEHGEVVVEPGHAQHVAGHRAWVRDADPPADTHELVLCVDECLEGHAVEQRGLREVEDDAELAVGDAGLDRLAQPLDAGPVVERAVG